MLRKFIRKLRRNKVGKTIINIVFMFIFEVIGNGIIPLVPIHFVRKMFYRKILRVDIDDNVYILKGCYLYPDLGDCVIGSNTIINQDTIMDRRAGLYIGKNVNISREVAIYTGGHDIDSINFGYYGKSVRIGDMVWIGTRSMIMPGVTINKGAVILPGAIVTHDCEEFGVYGGVPARKISERNKKIDYTLNWRSCFL